MTYIPGTGPQPLFPAAHLSLCPLVCPLSLSHLETTITLHTDHTGQGCDRCGLCIHGTDSKAKALHIKLFIFRDTYSLQSQRKMCGASNQAVELLPAQSGMLSISVVIFLQKREALTNYICSPLFSNSLFISPFLKET